MMTYKLLRGKKKKLDQLSNDWVGIFSLGTYPAYPLPQFYVAEKKE